MSQRWLVCFYFMHLAIYGVRACYNLRQCCFCGEVGIPTHLLMIEVVFHWKRQDFLMVWDPHLFKKGGFVPTMRYICIPTY